MSSGKLFCPEVARIFFCHDGRPRVYFLFSDIFALNGMKRRGDRTIAHLRGFLRDDAVQGAVLHQVESRFGGVEADCDSLPVFVGRHRIADPDRAGFIVAVKADDALGDEVFGRRSPAGQSCGGGAL